MISARKGTYSSALEDSEMYHSFLANPTQTNTPPSPCRIPFPYKAPLSRFVVCSLTQIGSPAPHPHLFSNAVEVHVLALVLRWKSAEEGHHSGEHGTR